MKKVLGKGTEEHLTKSKYAMKRVGNLYEQIISVDNLNEADAKARRGKTSTSGVLLHDKNREENIKKLHETLVRGDYRTSTYETFKIYEKKERIICRLPYYPDRIMHHAIMNVLEPIWHSIFTSNTYSCIKGRGIHSCATAVRHALMEHPSATKFCLKLDIRKFYPSVDHGILKNIVRRKIKDERLLSLLDEIIDSSDTLPKESILKDKCGIPIGNYLSQYFANIYLTYFDHWMKEQLRLKYYYRYADDMVILSDDKIFLHDLLAKMRAYLWQNLRLTIKHDYQIFPVDARGIDFVGYRFFHTHTLLRKCIKKNLCREAARQKKKGNTDEKRLKVILCGWTGWAKFCNSRNLLKKLNITNYETY